MIGVVEVELVKVLMDLIICNGDGLILFIVFIISDCTDEAWDRMQEWFYSFDAITHITVDRSGLIFVPENPIAKPLEANAHAASFLEVAQSTSFEAWRRHITAGVTRVAQVLPDMSVCWDKASEDLLAASSPLSLPAQNHARR